MGGIAIGAVAIGGGGWMSCVPVSPPGGGPLSMTAVLASRGTSAFAATKSTGALLWYDGWRSVTTAGAALAPPAARRAVGMASTVIWDKGIASVAAVSVVVSEMMFTTRFG